MKNFPRGKPWTPILPRTSFQPPNMKFCSNGPAKREFFHAIAKFLRYFSFHISTEQVLLCCFCCKSLRCATSDTTKGLGCACAILSILVGQDVKNFEFQSFAAVHLANCEASAQRAAVNLAIRKIFILHHHVKSACATSTSN